MQIISPINKLKYIAAAPMKYGNKYQRNRCAAIIGNNDVIKNVNANMLCSTGQLGTLNAVSNNNNNPGICQRSEENKKYDVTAFIIINKG